jgi:hypothetical protein
MYADIVEIVAPGQAAAGGLVNVEVRVKNLATYGIYIAVTGVFDSTQITFTPGYSSVNAGATYSFYGSFTMPSKKVTITAYSWYWTGSEWYQDDKMTKTVDLTALTPQINEFKIAAFNKV